jgi:hypothetical protein
LASVEKFAKNRPDASIGIISGFNELSHGRRSTITIDYDDLSAIGQLEEAIGRHPTPCIGLSKRGEHHTYAAYDEHGDPVDLRHFTTTRHHGINADFKHSRDGKGMVIVPQSIHKDGVTRYRWKEGSGPEALKEAPPFPIRPLLEFLDRMADEKRPGVKDRPLRDDSRAQGLNDYLVSQVAWCASRSELLVCAETWNDEIPNKFGKPPLEQDKVEDRVNVVWNQHLEAPFIKMFGSSGYARISDDEYNQLAELSTRYGGDASMLLGKLRIKHTKRVFRGETFCICPDAMAREQTLPTWRRERYENARDVLLEAGLIVTVSPYKQKRLLQSWGAGGPVTLS